MKREFSAGVVVYHEHQGQRTYLLLQYARGAHQFWDLPKGHIEAGESKLDAALRELKEEAGITAVLDTDFEESLSYYFTDHKTKQPIFKTVYFFIGKATHTTVTLSHEHIGFDWLSYDQALTTLTYESARHLLHKVEMHLHKKHTPS